MTIWETIGTFGGIPLAITALIVLGVYGKALLRQPNRYRPGRPWNYPPTWFVPHPDAVVQAQAATHSQTSTTAVGGASGEW